MSARVAPGFRRAALVGCALALSGCLFGIQVVQAPPEPPPPPLPDRFEGKVAPELVPSTLAGCQAAPSLDPDLYYCSDEHWYRFALNRWFMAFTWDGNWFPTKSGELPEGLDELTPDPEVVKKTREERLEELEKQLEELEQQPQPDADLDPEQQAP